MRPAMKALIVKTGPWLLTAALCGVLGGLPANAAQPTPKKAPAPPNGQMAKLGGAPAKANRATLGEKGNPQQGAVGGNQNAVTAPVPASAGKAKPAKH